MPAFQPMLPEKQPGHHSHRYTPDDVGSDHHKVASHWFSIAGCRDAQQRQQTEIAGSPHKQAIKNSLHNRWQRHPLLQWPIGNHPLPASAIYGIVYTGKRRNQWQHPSLLRSLARGLHPRIRLTPSFSSRDNPPEKDLVHVPSHLSQLFRTGLCSSQISHPSLAIALSHTS